jgi:thymidylate kinase
MPDITTLQMKPRSVLVFEGLDKAGKSTQLQRLKAILDPTDITYAHMPSGDSAFTRLLYGLLENVPPDSGLAKQLAHLACHSENMPSLVKATCTGSLILDRWWWSTIAYGWFGGGIDPSVLSENTFRDLIASIWAPIRADRVLLFLNPFEDDDNNNEDVARGYLELAGDNPGAHLVPALPPDVTHEYVLRFLVDEGLARPGGSPARHSAR